jgi:hypothetical protein
VIGKKQQLGQYYTRTNPFAQARFHKWINSIPNYPNISVVEPFAGSNSIVQMMLATYPELSQSKWTAFDIDPEAQGANQVPGLEVKQMDTISSFPTGFNLCITNPPYLAKNSATRKRSSIDFGIFQDLFEISLDVMLRSCAWVAAIVPESFITRGIFLERLEFVISLTSDMFDDTEFPVCLAVFSEQQTGQDFEIWRNEIFLGNYSQLMLARDNLLTLVRNGLFTFNDPTGPIGLYAVDMTKGPSIRFVPGKEIDPATIKHSSRAITRITPTLAAGYSSDVIVNANKVLAEYRAQTNDVFLTSFKGLRDDGQYRRRLDWHTATRVLATAILMTNDDASTEILPSPKFPW